MNNIDNSNGENASMRRTYCDISDLCDPELLTKARARLRDLNIFNFEDNPQPLAGFNSSDEVKQAVEEIKQLPLKEGDVLLCSHPRSGTHWTYEILHMVVTQQTEVFAQRIMTYHVIEWDHQGRATGFADYAE